MNNSTPIRRLARSSEEGFGLLAVIFLVALLTISLAIALPKVIKQIQRDREIETMHRGKQYARAVQMYYKKFGSYPPNVDVLAKGVNNIRFLRKKYSDPTTGKEEWKPVFLGQNKAPTAMGFFGQPLGGVGGCGPSNPLASGSMVMPGSATIGGSPSSTTDSSSNCVGSGLSPDTSSPTGGPTAQDPSAATQNPAGNAGQATSSFGAGQTFGGAGIMGFSPNSPKQSIMIYKKKNHYNEWEFVYDPRVEQMQAAGGGQGVVNNGLSGTGSGSGAGSGVGSGSGLGGGGGSGSGSGAGSGSGGGTGGTSSP